MTHTDQNITIEGQPCWKNEKRGRRTSEGRAAVVFAPSPSGPLMTTPAREAYHRRPSAGRKERQTSDGELVWDHFRAPGRGRYVE